jgi:hypothetical protein
MEKHGYWFFPFLLFLTVRLFSADTFFMLGGDQCTFLELGRTFPTHQLYNHELFLTHPPLFGYAIGILSILLPLLVSGQAAVLIFAALGFFAIRNLALEEGLPHNAIAIGLICIAINRPAVHYDSHVSRVSILVFATAFALLAFLRFLRTPGRRTLLVVIGANVFALLVGDQAIFLVVCETVIFCFRGRGQHWKSASWLAAVSMVAALIWPAVRLVEYSHRNSIPAGVDGTIELTAHLPWMAIIQPNFLPFTNAQRSVVTQTSLSLLNVKPDRLLGMPTDLLILPWFVGAVIVLLLVVAALMSPERRIRAIQWLILTLIFLLPVGVGMHEWYSSGFLIPFALLMMEGAGALLSGILPRIDASDEGVSRCFAVLCTVGVVLWLAAPPRDVPSFRPHGGRHFLFSRQPITRGVITSRFFESEPRETGIMAPVNVEPEVLYLTDKRVMALPFDPSLLDRFIADYHITYLVTSTEFLKRYDNPSSDRYLSAQVSRYIAEHPERCRPVRSATENYGAFYGLTTYYIFKVEDISDPPSQ